MVIFSRTHVPVVQWGGTNFKDLPTISIIRTKLAIMVPPVAVVQMNRNTMCAHNHGTKAAALPEKAWMITAAIKGPLRPYLKLEITPVKLERKDFVEKIDRFPK